MNQNRRPKVGFLQPASTFTHLAAMKQFGSNADYIPMETYAICQEDKDSTLDYGVLAIENVFEGTVGTTMDAVLTTEDLSVVGEIILPIAHHLLSNGETSEITRIYSHQQAISQCRKNIAALEKELGHKIEIITEASTARGAERAAQSSEKGSAAIAPEIAAEQYNLKILRTHMEDEKDNATRFWVLGQEEPSKPSGNDKTTFSFDVQNQSGALVSVLDTFSSRGLSATMLQSRPSKLDRSAGIWEYTFFAEFLGLISEGPLSESYDLLSNGTNSVCKRIRLLGSYPRFSNQ